MEGQQGVIKTVGGAGFLTLFPRKLDIAVGKTCKSNEVRHRQIEWSDFVERLRKPKRSPETLAEFLSMSPDQQSRLKDVGYVVGGAFNGNQRKASNLKYRSILSLDCDHGGPDTLACIRHALARYTYAVHSTRKHRTSHPRLRIYLPLTRNVSSEEYRPIIRKLTADIDIELFDAKTDEAARVMFWPSLSADSDYVLEVNDADWLDPDNILNSYDDWRDASQWPESDKHHKRHFQAVKKAPDPRQKTGLVGAFCRVYGIEAAILEFIPDAYEKTSYQRYSYTDGSTANGAVCYDDLWLYSHHESDPCSGQLVNAFDLVRLHRFGNQDGSRFENLPMTQRPSYKAMRDLCEKDKLVSQESLRDVISDFNGLSETDLTHDTGWLWKLRKTKAGGIARNSTFNLSAILENDHRLQIFAFNELKQQCVIMCDTPWRPCEDKINGDPLCDEDVTRLQIFIDEHYRVCFGIDACFRAVHTLAKNNSFHPVRGYLERLSWDGVERLDTMLSTHLGVEDTSYARNVSRKFMCGAVARVFEPGCKFDYCVILEGAQGLGKSTFLRLLSRQEKWFGDGVPCLGGKEAIEYVQGRWIVELSELEAFKRVEDVARIKAFMTRQIDRARLAYARTVSENPRQCVLVGTTNSAEYLKDATGNRRFWPVICKTEKLDRQALEAVINQLWAEAVVKYQAGEKLYFDDEKIEQTATREQSLRVWDDGISGVIEEWLLSPVEPFDDPNAEAHLRTKVCARQIWDECVGIKGREFSKAWAHKIGYAMNQIDGWSKSAYPIRFKYYGKQKAWVKTDKN